jgi:hypothetical protein
MRDPAQINNDKENKRKNSCEVELETSRHHVNYLEEDKSIQVLRI